MALPCSTDYLRLGNRTSYSELLLHCLFPHVFHKCSKFQCEAFPASVVASGVLHSALQPSQLFTSASRKEHFPCPESNLGTASHYEASVHPMVPFQHGQSSVDFSRGKMRILNCGDLNL